MTIKHLGGIFGRNPTFNEVEVESLSVAQSVEIASGNLIIGTSGNGIDFSVTGDGSGTTSSELFDDYEEGAWTPIVVGTSTAGSAVYTVQQAWYTKAGNIVSAHCQIVYNSHDGTGDLRIQGLPFNTFSSDVNAPVAVGSVFAQNLTFLNQLVVRCNRNSNQIVLFTMLSGTAGGTVSIDAAASLYVSLVYRAI